MAYLYWRFYMRCNSMFSKKSIQQVIHTDTQSTSHFLNETDLCFIYVFLHQKPKQLARLNLSKWIGHRDMICYHYAQGFPHSVGSTSLIYVAVPKVYDTDALVSFLWVYQEQNQHYCE